MVHVVPGHRIKFQPITAIQLTRYLVLLPEYIMAPTIYFKLVCLFKVT